MSLHNIKKSIFALPMLGTAAIASIFAVNASLSNNLSQIEQSTTPVDAVAYRASGRFDTGWLQSYRASGRFGTGMQDVLAYRGSERGVEHVAYRASGRLGTWGELISYRASGRFGHGWDGLAYRGSERGVEQVAYRASGRFGTLENLAYRGSERGVGSEDVS